MEVVFKDESIEEDEFIKELEEQGIFNSNVIDISKILRKDRSINLELLEIVVGHILKENKTIILRGLRNYSIQRGVILGALDKGQLKTEVEFITRYIKKFSEEFSESEIKVEVLWIKDAQYLEV